MRFARVRGGNFRPAGGCPFRPSALRAEVSQDGTRLGAALPPEAFVGDGFFGCVRGEREVQGDSMQGETAVLGMVLRLHGWTSFRLSAPGRSPGPGLSRAGVRPLRCTFHPARSGTRCFTSTAVMRPATFASRRDLYIP